MFIKAEYLDEQEEDTYDIEAAIHSNINGDDSDEEVYRMAKLADKGK